MSKASTLACHQILNTCYGLPPPPQITPPSYPTCINYDLCYNGLAFTPEYAHTVTVMDWVPSDPGVGDGNELQIALDGSVSTASASENTEACLNHVTTHNPTNTITSNTDNPLKQPERMQSPLS
jgi:hypothetical protein